jgi:hypothetical protein
MERHREGNQERPQHQGSGTDEKHGRCEEGDKYPGRTLGWNHGRLLSVLRQMAVTILYERD